MKATIKLAGGSRLIEVEGVSQKDLFEEMAKAHEVFGEATCGLCGSTNIRPVVRVVDKFRFYEYSCQEPGCWAKLSFGQAQEGDGLFPKRKLLPNGKPDKDGEFGPHKGWTKYRGEGHEEPPNDPEPATRPEQKPAGPPAYTKLRDLIVEIGVKAGESKAANALIEYCTSHLPGGKITLAFAQKFPGVSEEAIKCIQDARANFSDAELLTKAQEKMRKP